MSDKHKNRSIPSGQGRFATTHWSVVQAAGLPNSSRYKSSLETLCKTYWYPLYAYLRRHGYNADQASDYTQAFFARIMEKQSIRLADPKRGKFRSFLLTSLKNFIADEYDRSQAQKRGGGKNILSLDFESAEGQYSLEPKDQSSPEKLFERSWAITLLKNTLDRLSGEYKDGRKKKLFEHLKIYLTTDKKTAAYSDIAEKLQMAEGAVKVAVHRLRKRYRELLKEEIAHTVNSENEVDEEINELFKALSG
ncbi:MAG: RNA polymerase sigma factor [Planctomycetota bacterium]|jgi:RNA polymerase sigma-70 factor (ECF subfamily)